MKIYAKIIDEKTKICNVGLGKTKNAEEYYKSVGMELLEVEEAYNGYWYLKGYAPAKPQDVKEDEIRDIRNKYLEETDKYLSIIDYPITEEKKELYKSYRIYLRNYTEKKDWYEKEPLTFEEWVKNGR